MQEVSNLDNFLHTEVYLHLCKTIQPYVRAGLLPPSVMQSVDFLLDFYLTTLKEVENEATT